MQVQIRGEEGRWGQCYRRPLRRASSLCQQLLHVASLGPCLAFQGLGVMVTVLLQVRAPGHGRPHNLLQVTWL